MKQQKIHVPIKGMHCRSCELLIEEDLSRIPEITRAQASFAAAGADVYYRGQKPQEAEIEKAIRSAGYEVGANEPVAC